MRTIHWLDQVSQAGGGIDTSVSDDLFRYCSIQDFDVALGGSTNTDADPMFIGTSNFRLKPGSPLIDFGLNSAVPLDSLNVADVDPQQHNPNDPVPDLDLLPRILDALGDSSIVVDAGAFEFQCQVPDCVGDLDDDDEVGVSDLLDMLGEFGACADPGDCPADLSCDGTVNVTDILILLGSFGECPTSFSAEVAAQVQDCLNEHGYEESPELEACLNAINYE